VLCAVRVDGGWIKTCSGEQVWRRKTRTAVSGLVLTPPSSWPAAASTAYKTPPSHPRLPFPSLAPSLSTSTTVNCCMWSPFPSQTDRSYSTAADPAKATEQRTQERRRKSELAKSSWKRNPHLYVEARIFHIESTLASFHQPPPKASKEIRHPPPPGTPKQTCLLTATTTTTTTTTTRALASAIVVARSTRDPAFLTSCRPTVSHSLHPPIRAPSPLPLHTPIPSDG